MATEPFAAWMLEQEARALLTRLERVKPFALHETMLPAANILPTAQTAIERYLMQGRRELKDLIQRYLGWLRRPEGQTATPAQAQPLVFLAAVEVQRGVDAVRSVQRRAHATQRK